MAGSALAANAFAQDVSTADLGAEVVVTGQRVIPAKAQAHGYHFRYPELDIAFRGIFGD